ncbi:MAG: GNAT family N-acetyltransferase [Clostridia bacterium]|nr:GNAT family N-acetyltransferase [Clostridia bacterium]
MLYKLVVLEKCGHTPWHEIHAKEKFKKLIQEECVYFFETERIKFRHFNPSDDMWFSEMNADPEVMRYFPSILTKEESDHFLNRIFQSYLENGFGLYVAVCKKDATPIGFIGLSRPNFKSDFTPCVEIGWRLKQKYWHKGYGTEGAKAVLQYGFDVLRVSKIYSFTAVINEPSCEVMKRIGMAKVKTFNHPNVKNSPLEAHVLYEIVSKNGQEIQ